MLLEEGVEGWGIRKTEFTGYLQNRHVRILLLLLLLFPYLLPKFFSFTFFSRYSRVSSLMLRLRQAHQGSSEGWNQPLGWGRGAAQGDSASLQHLPQSIRWDFGITERWRRRRIKVLYEYFIRVFKTLIKYRVIIYREVPRILKYDGAWDVQIPLSFHAPMWYEKGYGQPKLRFLMPEQYHSWNCYPPSPARRELHPVPCRDDDKPWASCRSR